LKSYQAEAPCSALFRTESPEIIGETDLWLCDSLVRRVAQIERLDDKLLRRFWRRRLKGLRLTRH